MRPFLKIGELVWEGKLWLPQMRQCFKEELELEQCLALSLETVFDSEELEFEDIAKIVTEQIDTYSLLQALFNKQAVISQRESIPVRIFFCSHSLPVLQPKTIIPETNTYEFEQGTEIKDKMVITIVGFGDDMSAQIDPYLSKRAFDWVGKTWNQ